MTERSKAYYSQRSATEMTANLDAPELSVRQQLTVAARIMAMEGHDAGVAGQITARSSQPNRFWTLRFGVGFDEATPDAFILVDDDLKTVEGQGTANPATRFHLWVYRVRPDVQSIMHAHPPYISALSMLQTPLVVAHMDQTPFTNDCVFLAEWPGLPIADDEGRIISEALGDKSCLLLAHHGYLTAASTVAEASFLSVYLERAAKLQIRAASAGTIKPVSSELAAESGRFLRSSVVVETTFAYFARQISRHYGPECLHEG